jgi:hypothetical protein
MTGSDDELGWVRFSGDGWSGSGTEILVYWEYQVMGVRCRFLLSIFRLGSLLVQVRVRFRF